MRSLSLLLPLALFALLFLGPRKRAQQANAMQSALSPGDRVMTTSGLYGVLETVTDDVIGLRVAAGVVLHLAKRSVARRVDPADQTVPSASVLRGEAIG